MDFLVAILVGIFDLSHLLIEIDFPQEVWLLFCLGIKRQGEMRALINLKWVATLLERLEQELHPGIHDTARTLIKTLEPTATIEAIDCSLFVTICV